MDAAPDANGTIAVANTRSSHNNQIAYMHHCLQIGPQGKKDGSVGLATCLPEGSPDEAPSKPSQKREDCPLWTTRRSAAPRPLHG